MLSCQMVKPPYSRYDDTYGSTHEVPASSADDLRVFANVELSSIIARAMDYSRDQTAVEPVVDTSQSYMRMESELEEWRETWLPKVKLGGDGSSSYQHSHLDADRFFYEDI